MSQEQQEQEPTQDIIDSLKEYPDDDLITIFKELKKLLQERNVDISTIIEVPKKETSGDAEKSDGIPRCMATTKAGGRCRNTCKESGGFCYVHSEKKVDPSATLCSAITKANGPCKNKAKYGTKCGVHAPKQIVPESAVVTTK
jgi:hypothetical protein